MTKEKAKQYLPLVQAFAEGKTIQFRYSSDDNWVDARDLNFYLQVDHYRIKPEPIKQEFYYIIHKENIADARGCYFYKYTALADAEKHLKVIDPKGENYVIMHANATSVSDI